MRLVTKISIYHFLLSSIVLGLAGFLLFIYLRAEISLEIEEQLELQVDMIAKELGKGKHIDFPLVTIKKDDEKLMQLPKVFKDTLIYDYVQDVTEGYYYFVESKRINGKPHRIKVFTTYIGWENYAKTISFIFIAIAAMLVLLGTLVNYFISRSIWAPFLINLKRIKDYSVSAKEDLQLATTHVKEFQEMNTVLADLAARAKREYNALKEFTENASHELQTPLSILKARLESIGQLPLDALMIRPLNDAKEAVSRLSKLNKGLLLLAKLENDAFADKAWVSLDQVIYRNCEIMEDLFETRGLKLEYHINPKMVFASASLMDILITNLISNILNYSRSSGKVSISLDGKKLIFVNEGSPLPFPQAKLFARFIKGDSGANRNGLGLSIVKQICVNNKWVINYEYREDSHVFRIDFS